MIRIDPSVIKAKSVDFYINSKCNLSCSTCFLGDDYFSSGKQMSLRQISNCISYLEKTRVNDIALLGGEPTLHPEFVSLLKLFRERVPTWTLRLVSNGNRFARTKFQNYCHLVDAVYVSLDSPIKERNDDIRGKGSFNDAISFLQLLAEANIDTVLNMCISRKNMDDMSQMFSLAADVGAGRLNIHWTSPTGRAAASNISLGKQEWLGILQQFKTLSNEYKQKIKSDIQTAFRIEKADKYKCLIGDLENFQILPDGSVYLCGLHVDDPEMSAIHFDGDQLYWNKKTHEAELFALRACGECPSKVRLDQSAQCIYHRTFC